MEAITVAFFGISGSGKGTQVSLLDKALHDRDPVRAVVKPEMGNLLRAFMQTGTPMARSIGDILNVGGLVPSFMPIYLLTKIFNESFDGSQHIVLDGVCLRKDQSRAANDLMRMFGREKLQAIVLNLSEENAKTRLGGRGRFDDAKDAAIQSRFRWYKDEVVPSIEELRACGWTIHEIDGEPDIQTVHKNILKQLQLV